MRLRPAEVRSLTGGSLAFGVDLYRELAGKQKDFAMSPLSLADALAMTYAGAGGATARQMARTLHFEGTAAWVARGFGALDQELAAINQHGVRLDVADSLWGQRGLAFRRPYLDLLARYFGAGVELVDYESAPEAARVAINAWVGRHTHDKITELLARGVIDKVTRLVLANAVYLKADWLVPFDRSHTHDGPFFTSGGRRVTASLMTKTDTLAYARGDGYRAVELPYRGKRLEMVIVMPDRGTLGRFEHGLGERPLDRTLARLTPARLELTLPRFTFSSRFALAAALRRLGMKQAFSDQADFSEMTKAVSLKLKEVVHQAYVKVDETGTEAAAATGVIAEPTAVQGPPLKLTIDHPFVFLIRDRLTGAPLFLGRVVDPTLAG